MISDSEDEFFESLDLEQNVKDYYITRYPQEKCPGKENMEHVTEKSMMIEQEADYENSIINFFMTTDPQEKCPGKENTEYITENSMMIEQEADYENSLINFFMTTDPQDECVVKENTEHVTENSMMIEQEADYENSVINFYKTTDPQDECVVKENTEYVTENSMMIEQEADYENSVFDYYNHILDVDCDENVLNFASREKSIDDFKRNCQSPKPTRKSRRTKIPTRKKLIYIANQKKNTMTEDYGSGSDSDNIPLSHLIRGGKRKMFESESSDSDIGLDKTYQPTSKDLNSTDSEYMSDASEKTIKFREQKKKTKKLFEKALKKSNKSHKTRTKQNIITKKKKKSTTSYINKEKKIVTDSSDMSVAMNESMKENLIQKARIKAAENTLDEHLKTNSLRRVKIPGHGNCFFEASIKSCESNKTPEELRQLLCKHLEQNSEEYACFLLNLHKPEDDEVFLNEYLDEVENLKRVGYWSNRVADFLPLALANFEKKSVLIYTNKEEQPIIKIRPNLVDIASNDVINLAYISIPGLIEHYDACVIACNTDSQNITSNVNDLNDNDHEMFVATPISTQTNATPKKSAGSNTSATPRKTANYNTPMKRRLVRKRKATPENWKRNIRKKLRLSGKQYISNSGKSVPEKKMKDIDCTKCRFKCTEKFSKERRSQIFQFFWAIGNYERQKDFVCTNITTKPTKSYLDEKGEAVQKKQKVRNKFHFELDGHKHQVCKEFFLGTLAISEAFTYHALHHKEEGHFCGMERRGKCTPSNKISNDRIQFVKDHIDSFPRVPGHYTRKDSNREYLGADLNITRMYELYKAKCTECNCEPVKSQMYRKIFNEEYNISFHIPKKDKCNLCSKYEMAESDGTLTEDLKQQYNLHHERKVLARDAKERDKQQSKNDSKLHVCAFDLQSVLYTPCTLVSLMYYMRKLCVYNLSVYALKNGEGSCFLWSETNGMRGSSEIATCLRLYLLALPAEVEHVILYSDACTGQNRNQIMASALLHFITYNKNINTIDHKFLESGHTQNECDSVHSAVEFAKRKTKIYVPSQWDTVITMARRRDPYHVIPLGYTDILDFKDVKEKQVKVQTSAKVKVSWNQIRHMRFTKTFPDTMLFKNDPRDDFTAVKIVRDGKLREAVPNKYRQKIPISAAKKRDLMTLCKNGTIPKDHHDYYKNLPSSSTVKDKLPESDIEESDRDESDN